MIYHCAVLLGCLAMTGTAALNFLFFRKPRALVGVADSDLPMVSVLVPARNEETTIEACVRSLLAMNYPNFEVIVLDDRSTDSTYEILCRLRDQDHRLHVLVGAEMPEGWYGKPHACWQLANAANGEYLLMTDADCTFAPDALLLALGARQEHQADVVSMTPDLQCQGFWEQMIIPLQYFIVFAFLPGPLIRITPFPWFAAANGAFIFLRRDTYFEVDGHRAVRRQLAEDIKFSQHVKRRGKTLWYGDGSRTYAVRMYHGLAEIWAGFSKNIFPAFSRDLPLLATVLAYLFCALVLPAPLAVWGWTHHKPWAAAALAAYLLTAGVRLALSARFLSAPAWAAPLLPLGWLCVIGIALNSIRQSYSKTGNLWKGRSYPKT
ncbi:glycosyl hydrolase [Capsulimonas corticalis]|uniref:Glycosyl hydrolase n=1 Tax=Capsulimonas corticalis TaxID=2219043 RepID=A0A402CPX4_9BACT|nr:glycosyltransferase family 2 protein [Capsulimonas corticalis]BDI32859.1 glycosyl hydrolase [Capsulimonas corticalis]